MTLPSVAEYATEYFVSYYDCRLFLCIEANNADHTCPKRSDECEHWRLLYRCCIGNLTEKELEHFKQKTDENNLDPFTLHITIVSPDYALHSVDDLRLDSLEAREEHFQARELFENLAEWNYLEPRTKLICFQHIAEEIREMRYGEVPIPCFVDKEIARIFYGMETTILEQATRRKIQAINKEQAKPDAKVTELEAEKTRLNVELIVKLQKLKELQEKSCTQITPLVVVGESCVAPPITIAASGKGIPKSAVDAYQEAIESAEAPANVSIRAY